MIEPTEQSDVIYVDGVPYACATFDAGQKYLLHQIADLQQKSERLDLDKHQNEVAKRAFLEALSGSLRKAHVESGSGSSEASTA